MVSNLSVLENKTEQEPHEQQRVHLPNGGTIVVTDIGSSSFTGIDTLDNILYIPYFKYNLLSVS